MCHRLKPQGQLGTHGQMPESLDSWPGLPVTFSQVHGRRQQLELGGAGEGGQRGAWCFLLVSRLKKRST